MKKESWLVFEEDCRDFLTSKFGGLGDFSLAGAQNSNVSDIKVTLPNGATFYIEVKENHAQCSQFVLIPDDTTQRFAYSTRNKLPMNPFTKRIIEYMNENYSVFSQAGKSGVRIDPLLAASAGHIRYQHMMKGVEFFMTKGDDYILLPVSLFAFYFDVIGMYRTKKSGSAPIPRKEEDPLNEYLREHCGFECQRVGQDFTAPLVESMIKKEINIGGCRYAFADAGEQIMRLRKLGNTENGTVIFTVHLKKSVEGLPLSYFESFMRMASR